jgi:hypothetical protein
VPGKLFKTTFAVVVEFFQIFRLLWPESFEKIWRQWLVYPENQSHEQGFYRSNSVRNHQLMAKQSSGGLVI